LPYLVLPRAPYRVTELIEEVPRNFAFEYCDGFLNNLKRNVFIVKRDFSRFSRIVTKNFYYQLVIEEDFNADSVSAMNVAGNYDLQILT